MTLAQLKYVVTVSKTLNISAAAKKLYLSQPSLTKAINELEKEMNIKIFKRNNKGVSLTPEGDIFLAHANQVLEQANYLEEKYKAGKYRIPDFSVSCQHYSFVVEALSDTIEKYDAPEYSFTIRETQTYEIIEDVISMKSALGILFLSQSNKDILTKIFKQNELVFDELITVDSHVFFSENHPLHNKKSISLADLSPYPYISFEQGEKGSSYFAEETFSMIEKPKNILVRDRATMTNLMNRLNAYTVSTGIVTSFLDKDKIIAKKLVEKEPMRIGYIHLKNVPLSDYAKTFIDSLRRRI